MHPAILGILARLRDSIAYDLKALFTGSDQTFTDGQVLNTAAEGVETGSLTVVDTSVGGSVKLVSNELECVNPTTSTNSTGVYGNDSISRTLGKAFFFVFKEGIANSDGWMGFTSPAQLAPLGDNYIAFSNRLLFFNTTSGVKLNYVTLAAATEYQVLLVLGGYNSSGIPFKTGDSAEDFLYGMSVLIKGGVFTNWTMLWRSSASNTSTLFPTIQDYYPESLYFKNLLIPTEVLDVDVMFQPVFLDTFAGDDDDQLVSDHTPEVVGGATGTGNPWESGGTTWTIQSNAAVNTGYTGTLNTEALTDDMSIEDGVFDVEITSDELLSGFRLCLDSVSSPANHIDVYYDFDNGKVEAKKVVAGSPTTLITVAKAYSAGAQLRAILNYDATAGELKLRAYYNDALIGTEQTIDNAGIVGNTRHGIMSTSTTNSLEKFTVHNKTNSAWDAEISRATGDIY